MNQGNQQVSGRVYSLDKDESSQAALVVVNGTVLLVGEADNTLPLFPHTKLVGGHSTASAAGGGPHTAGVDGHARSTTWKEENNI